MIFRKPTGLCYACGRPTRLLVHEGCGKDRREAGQRVRTERYRRGRFVRAQERSR